MGSLPLLVVWLVLVILCPGIAICAICAMGATPMFANCSNINSDFTNSGGGDFEAIGCNYPPKETVVSLGWIAGTTATVFIAYGKVAAGASASLSVKCPTTVTSHSLHVTVTGIAFGQDASFRFTGALPPRSSLHISNNTFLLTRQNLNTFQDPWNSFYTPAILFGDSATAIVLEEGTAMSANNNSVTCRWAAGGSQSVAAVNVIGASATLRSLSTLSISGNSIVNSSFSIQAYVAYLLLYSSRSSSLSLSNITMSGNSIVSSSSYQRVYVAYLFVYSSIGLTLCNQSAITMSSNTIASSSSSIALIAFVQLSSSSLSLFNQSAIAISGNSIVNSNFSSSAVVAFLFLSSGSSMTLSNQSAVDMNGNSIANCNITNIFGGDVSVALLDLSGDSSLSLSNQSAITMSGNSIVNSSISKALYVANLGLHTTSGSNSLSLFTGSAITMSGNRIASISVGSSGSVASYVVYLSLFSYSSSSSSSLSLSNQSTIAMSGNSITNSSIGYNIFVAYLYLYNYGLLPSRSINLTLSDQSAITMSGNNCSQIRSGSVSLVAIEVYGPFSLKGMASVSMDRNNADVTYGPSAVLLIRAWHISLNDSSRISATGNTLQAPVGQGDQLSSLVSQLLAISSSSDSSVLSISGKNSSLVVALNDIVADAMALNVTMQVSAEYPSTIAIVDNHISGRYVSRLATFSKFYLNGVFIATGNSVEAPSYISNFSLVTIASTFTNGSMASVQACGNYLSWVGHIRTPRLYLKPTAFAVLAGICPTLTVALLASQSISSSTIVTLTQSLSNTSDATQSLTLVGAKTWTQQPPTTEQQSPSMTIEPTNSQANCSKGVICQLVKVASGQSAIFDTCTEPGTSATAAKDSTYVPLAKYIGNAAKQAVIKSSNQRPALSGNAFYYGSVSVQLPEGMANVTHVSPASTSMAACWVHSRSANATEIRVAVEALPVAAGTALDSASVPVVLMVLSVNVSCGAAAVVFNRTIAMERPVVYLPKVFVPEKAVHDAATITGALSVTVGAVAVPIAAMQQGVALALLRMAQCEEDALNGEPLDVSVHPLQFGLGVGSGRYGRGALLGNLLVIPLIWCALLYLLVPFAIRALTGRTLDASRDFVGWPGMALMPLAVLSEGSAMASVGLLTQGAAGDIIMGLIGLAILFVTTASWAAELRRMRRQVVLRRASNVAGLVKAVHPRFEWEVAKGNTEVNTVARASYLDKRMQLVGSSWWLWSALAAHVLSIVVGVAESLPVSSGMCRARWAVASLAAVLQAAVVMTSTVPVELLPLGVIGVMSCILVVLIALSTFDVVSPGSTFSALNAVGMANSIFGLLLLGLGALAAAYETIRKRSRRASEPSALQMSLSSLMDGLSQDGDY